MSSPTYNTEKLVVLDARSKSAAVANGVMGYGYEQGSSYSFCDVLFCNIPNIHRVRECLKALSNLIENADPACEWYSDLHDTGWLQLQKLILKSANFLVKCILKKISVVIHCSDGWDRTAQIATLGEMVLDPYYRTIEGFIVLIEKDWVSFGHQFDLRTGYDNSNDTSQRAPIFHQYIECVWQITQQYPNAFQFNEYLLIFIIDQLYGCRFGTFLYASDREREEYNIKETTSSLWTFVYEHLDQFMNPYYKRETKPLLINSSEKALKFWTNYYFRWTPLKNSNLSFYEITAPTLYELKLKLT